MPTLLVPVFATPTHSTVEKLFKRYLDTFVHLKKWYESDIFDKKSEGHKSIKKVNLLHKKVFRDVNPSDSTDKLFMTQFDMVVTQWSSVAPIILFPKQYGLHHVTDDDLMAVAHHWRAIGHTLGIVDKFNCCAGSLAEAQYFCKLILEHDVLPNVRKDDPESSPLGLKMASSLAQAMNCLTGGWVCLHGLFRYTLKSVLEVTTYVPVKNRKGYRNMVHLLTVLMTKWWWHWALSVLVRFALWCVSWRQQTIAQHFRKKYSHIDYFEEYKQCPFAKKWQ